MKRVELTISFLVPKELSTEEAIKRITLGEIIRSAVIRASDNQSVLDFQDKFQVPMPYIPTSLDRNTFEFRSKFLQEELTEFNESYAEGDLHGQADALIDLAYVIHGTALMMGLPWGRLWEEVQRANMSKVRATSAEQSKRGSSLDVIKPEGWKAPDFTPILGPNHIRPPSEGSSSAVWPEPGPDGLPGTPYPGL